MSVNRPGLDQMRKLIGGSGMSMSDRDILDYMSLMENSFQAYDEALSRHDLLLMPTMPIKSQQILPPDAPPLSLFIQRAFEMIGNTAPFDATGHPAMSVPCGLSDGLPIGMMLIGKHYEESTIYRAAAAFERSGDWRAM